MGRPRKKGLFTRTPYTLAYAKWLASLTPVQRERARELDVDYADPAKFKHQQAVPSLDVVEENHNGGTDRHLGEALVYHHAVKHVEEEITEATPFADALSRIMWDLTLIRGRTEGRTFLGEKIAELQDKGKWAAPLVKVLLTVKRDRSPCLGAWTLLLYCNRVDLRQDQVALVNDVVRATVSLRLRKYREKYPELPAPRVCRPLAVEPHRERARKQWQAQNPREHKNLLAEMRKLGPG